MPTRFRPCIDLHRGQVKQIVGSTLRDSGDDPETNFVSEHTAAWFAERYRRDDLRGGHIIQLGEGNEAAARSALAAWPGGMHLGGGVNATNAQHWLDLGAEKVIVTSWLFEGGQLSIERTHQLADLIGPEHLVIDLSCRRVAEGWHVATDRWQTLTKTPVSAATLRQLADFCSEFLIHAADLEGRRAGIDEDLVRLLGAESPIPVTYAGGGRAIEDLARVEALSGGRVDLTIGSALDLFGGTEVRYEDCVAWNRRCGEG